MMGKGVVYLAGPIRHVSYVESMTWRTAAQDWLEARGYRVLSPMRGKSAAAIAEMREDGTILGHFGTPKGITTRDRFDLSRADVVLANMLGAVQVSLGTCVEFGWADVMRIPVVMVIDKPGTAESLNPHHHAMLYEIAGYVTYSLNEGLRVAAEVMG